MVPVKLGMTEEELKKELLQYYDYEKVESIIIKNVKRNGFAAYGAFTVRKAIMPREEGREYNLFRLPGYIPPKRSEANA